MLVRSLSALQAFKDTETSGAYVGFIAGVLGANPARASDLIAKMLPIALPMNCGRLYVNMTTLIFGGDSGSKAAQPAGVR